MPRIIIILPRIGLRGRIRAVLSFYNVLFLRVSIVCGFLVTFAATLAATSQGLSLTRRAAAVELEAGRGAAARPVVLARVRSRGAGSKRDPNVRRSNRAPSGFRGAIPTH